MVHFSAFTELSTPQIQLNTQGPIQNSTAESARVPQKNRRVGFPLDFRRARQLYTHRECKGEQTMGTWGTGLYENDGACDVQDSYKGFLNDGLSNQEAYDKIMDMCQEYLGDEDEEPIFWFALADTQWGLGRLMPEVRSKALEWIDKGGRMPLWQESGNSAGWKKTLEKLKIKLNKPAPPEKKIRKPRVINQNLWNINDVYALHFRSEETKKYGVHGKYILMQKIGEGTHVYAKGVMMIIHVFDKLFDDIPTLEDMKGLRLLPCGRHAAPCQLTMSKLVALEKKKDYPVEQLTYIGNTTAPLNKQAKYPRAPSSWFHIEIQCAYSFQFWKGKEYESVGDGVFMYNGHE